MKLAQMHGMSVAEHQQWSGGPENKSNALSQLLRTAICVNCWHMNTTESAAMWKLYAPADGVCIQSTVGRMKDCFKVEITDVIIAPVWYVDFASVGRFRSAMNGYFRPYFVKRKSFHHERELRASLVDADVVIKKKTGRTARIDVNRLIETVFVSPNAGPWIKDVIESEVRIHGFRQKVLQSPILEFR